MSSFQLTEAQALAVSDHGPNWTEFSVYETPPPTPCEAAKAYASLTLDSRV